jgi:hypothetical protein
VTWRQVSRLSGKLGGSPSLASRGGVLAGPEEVTRVLHDFANSDVGSKLIVAAAGLLGAWLIGARVSDRWAAIKHRRETDLGALAEFYAAYGALFSVQKLWDARKRFNRTGSDGSAHTEESLKRKHLKRRSGRCSSSHVPLKLGWSL